MKRINFIIVLSCVALISVNCMQNCISEPIFVPPNENISMPNENFTISIQNNVIISGHNWNQSDDIELPFNVAPEISNYEREFIKVLSKNYLALQQPFDFTHLPTISHQCRKHANIFLESLKNFELWALKLHDASARFTSGLLNGNVNQLGDFDQCLSARMPNDEIRGKYCLAYLQPSVPTSLKFTNYLKRLVQSHEAFKSNFDDPGHRMPRLSTINFGVCIPSSCTNKDVEIAVRYYVDTFMNGTGVQMQIRVEHEMCYVQDDHWIGKLDTNTKIAIGFCIIFLAVTLLSTLYDYATSQRDRSEWTVSFSLIKNSTTLFSLDRDPNDIKIAHAIRFFNALMLLVSHKCMAMFYIPYSNRTAMVEMLGRPWTVLARAASLYTDPFLMLSGMLTAYSLYGKLQKTGRINILREYSSRYLRIMPPLAFLIMFCTFILPLVGNGPQWNLVVTHHADICKQHWWRNLLFIHNWFGFSDMCLTHTHHVGIDSELYWTAPFLILILFKWPKKGLSLIIALALASTFARYYVTFKYSLTNYVSFGSSVQQLFRTADLMYTQPPHRFTVYAMGLLLGYVLRKFKDAKLSRMQLRVGWYVTTASLLCAFFGPAPMSDISYKYNVTHAAHYAGLAPIAWCMFFGWLILSTQLGYQNTFTRILEWRGFLISTKISYALYLVQFPVYFYNVGTTKSTVQYGFPFTAFNFNEYIVVVVVALAFTLFIEYPFNNIKDLIFNNKKTNINKRVQCDKTKEKLKSL